MILAKCSFIAVSFASQPEANRCEYRIEFIESARVRRILLRAFYVLNLSRLCKTDFSANKTSG